ncbi:hypothetical protein VCSRO8_2634 [Vibrio cholerae]|nr:hypothetical protein VCSRO8_2634 [Vibrio cholerae]
MGINSVYLLIDTHTISNTLRSYASRRFEFRFAVKDLYRALSHRAQSLKPQRLNGSVGWEMVRALRLKQFCGRNGIRQRMVR